MTLTRSTLESQVDGLALATYHWPSASEPPRGLVQISHGVAEHSLRYDRLAEALVAAGYTVYAHDHRGHGASIGPGVPLGDFGEAGWAGLVTDLATFSEAIVAENPGLPLFLIGHSMGSFAAQHVVLTRSDLYRGLVLSGSTAVDLIVRALLEQAAGQPVELTSLNAAFENRTGFEWLSRDTAEVDEYVADPLSGTDLTDELVQQMFSSGAPLADPGALARIRSELPVLIVSGSDDPLAGGGQLVEALGARYRSAGLTDVTVHVYPGARHEIFNETNRDEITSDVIGWIDRHR